MIDSIHDLIKVLTELDKRDDIEELVEPVYDHEVLSSTNAGVLDAEDDTHDTVQQLEMCLSYYLFDQGSLVDKSAEAKLKKIGFSICKIDIAHYGFSYAVVGKNFSILFTL